MTSTVLPPSTRRLQHLEQLLDVAEVQAGRRLVEQVQRAAGLHAGELAARASRAAPRRPTASVAGWPSAR